MTREEGSQLRLTMWLFPYLSILAAGAILAVLVSMFYVESSRSQITLSCGALIVMLIAYQFRRRINPVGPHPLTANVAAVSVATPTR